MIRAQASGRLRLGPEKMDNFALSIFTAHFRPKYMDNFLLSIFPARIRPKYMDNFPISIFSARVRPNPAGADPKTQKTQGFLLGPAII